MIKKVKITVLFLLILQLLKTNALQAITIKSLNSQSISEKETFFIKQFDKKEKIKKTIYYSAGLSAALAASFLGYKYQKKTDVQQTKATQQDYQQETNHIQDLESELTFNKSLKRGFSWATSKAVVVSMTTISLLVSKDLFKLLKNHFISLFNPNEDKTFKKMGANLINNLNNLKSLFSSPNEENVYKEEIENFYNFFIENLENYIAIVKAASKIKIKNLNNAKMLNDYINFIYKKTNNFSEYLEKTLTVNFENSLQTKIDLQIWNNFKEIKIILIRFLAQSASVIYEG